MERKLSISVQDFEKLRTDHFLYADKTEYIFRLARQNTQYFLSRPRRFGKSLLLSTSKAYWEGRRDLFEGLKIEHLEAENPDAWKKYPVFFFDFNGQNYESETALDDVLDEHLKRWEEEYGIENPVKRPGGRFGNLLMKANEMTGLRSVILVDEYDKPLLETMFSPELEQHNKAVFKAFFSSLKSCDKYVQFAFITGVSKFEKVSIFSDLNQLNDISLSEEYSGICGFTEDELRDCFDPEVRGMAVSQDMTADDCYAALKQRYDGYRFHPAGVSVYNPFSLMKAFSEKDFGSYWFETGTPTFLVRMLKDTGFDVRKLTNRTLYVTDAALSDYRADQRDPVPLLYQTGYLTIVDYDKRRRRDTLGVPNEEVEYGLLESLMPVYTPSVNYGTGTDIYSLEEYAEEGNTDGMRNILTSLFASIPYTQEKDPFEHYFQTVIYLVFKLLGRFAVCEMHTFNGRVDCIVETEKFIYLFEFKRDGSADEALQQIAEMGYALPYQADPRKLIKIGVAFDSKKRILTEWKVQAEQGV